MRFQGMVLLCMALSAGAANVQFHYTGKVTDGSGTAIAGALVSVPATGTIVKTDESGGYVLDGEIDVALVTPRATTQTVGFAIRNGVLAFSLTRPQALGVSLYRLNGERIRSIPEKIYGAGSHSVRFSDGGLPSATYLIAVHYNGRDRIFSWTSCGKTRMTGTWSSVSAEQSVAAAASAAPLLRASAAGHLSSDTLAASFTGTYDFSLATMEQPKTGTAGQDDGSLDRLVYYGKEQYFWGDPNGTGTDMPLVKIVTAVSDDAVDIALIFNPNFVDNTYGTGKIGWNKHTFEQLVKSDHVALSVRNGDGTEVFAGKIDLISMSPDAPSGYATLGPYGGDGELTVGSKEYLQSFGTSMDDNLNYYGYKLLENSPPTDSVYTPHPEYPNWEYYAIYRISFDPAMFGPSGYGSVMMTSVHASPSKTKEETVTVTEQGPPADSDDPFTHTRFGNPPVDITENPDNPPTDPMETGGDTPPSDVIETGTNGDTPPSDSTETPIDKPPEDVPE